MYLVVSRWEPIAGHEQQFDEIGKVMRKTLAAQPGVELVEAFDSNGQKVVVHGYRDEAAYKAVIDDPNGPFIKAAQENRLEEHARWISSERGETVPR